MLRTIFVMALVLVAAQAKLTSSTGDLNSQRMKVLSDLRNVLRQEADCGGRGDIVFVVDSSSSVGFTNFGKVKSFMEDIVDSFTVGPDDVQFGVVIFSSSAGVEFNLNAHETADEVNKAINSMDYIGGGTDTREALSVMMNKAFTSVGGDRSDAPNIGIVITDGESSTDVTKNANAAKNMGITMFAVGIGNYNMEELKIIANEPSDEYVFPVSDFDGLDEIKDALAEKTCEATKPCKGAGEYENVDGMDDWCYTNCLACYCPATHCVCKGLDVDCPEKRRSETRNLKNLLSLF